MYMQVVRHERASVKADMWSYGILVWELISNQDITNLQPLAIAQAMQVSHSSSTPIPCCSFSVCIIHVPQLPYHCAAPLYASSIHVSQL